MNTLGGSKLSLTPVSPFGPLRRHLHKCGIHKLMPTQPLTHTHTNKILSLKIDCTSSGPLLEVDAIHKTMTSMKMLLKQSVL